jgi:biopolymer transport protein ExbD
VPVMKHAVNIDLPQASNVPQEAKPETIRLSVDAAGDYFWNENKVTEAALQLQLKTAATQNPQPELHIRGDKAVRYERVATVMAAAQQAGIKKIGFITEPKL